MTIHRASQAEIDNRRCATAGTHQADTITHTAAGCAWTITPMAPKPSDAEMARRNGLSTAITAVLDDIEGRGSFWAEAATFEDVTDVAKDSVAEIAVKFLTDAEQDGEAISAESAIEKAVGYLMRSVFEDRSGMLDRVAEAYGVKL